MKERRVKFFSVENSIIRNEDKIMESIKPEGFAIYNFLLFRQEGKDYIDFSIQTIIEYLNFGESLTIEYNGKKKNVYRMINPRLIKPYIVHLGKEGLIEVINGVDLNKIKVKDVVFCKIKKINFDDGGFTMFSSELFLNTIQKVGHIGWQIYSLLYTLHNKNFGNEFSEGFATPSIEYICEKTTLSTNIVLAYINLLEKLNLIRIIKNGRKFLREDVNGKSLYKSLPNNYIVLARESSNKYYLG